MPPRGTHGLQICLTDVVSTRPIASGRQNDGNENVQLSKIPQRIAGGPSDVGSGFLRPAPPYTRHGRAPSCSILEITIDEANRYRCARCCHRFA
jgi:hypothetical protein